ncbi:MAG: winged helix-turn-helix domain-containing protein [Paracoccaceae bacterium]|nr:winged helix-turn-helix domain-containing protein [Paracoccaceae bacterium]
MSSDFQMIVVDNDTADIVGSVFDFQALGFSMLMRQGENTLNLSFDTIDELLEYTTPNNIAIYYLVDSVRIPVNHTTYDKARYLDMVGWWCLTPAEAVIMGLLRQAKWTTGDWVSREQLCDVLEVFGFSPRSLLMHISRIRKKIVESNFELETKRCVGYRLVDPVNDPINAFLMKESRAKSDYWILFCDDKLSSFVKDNVQRFITGNRLSGSQILLGWHGLTRTEAEIFFELVKHRGELVSYEHLLALPCMNRSAKDTFIREKNLKNFVGNIRSKVEPDEVIITQYRVGYCLI